MQVYIINHRLFIWRLVGSPVNHKAEIQEARSPLKLPKLENIKHPSFHHNRRPSNSTSPSDLSSSSWGSNSSPRPQFNAGMEQVKRELIMKKLIVGIEKK